MEALSLVNVHVINASFRNRGMDISWLFNNIVDFTVDYLLILGVQAATSRIINSSSGVGNPAGDLISRRFSLRILVHKCPHRYIRMSSFL